MSAQDYIKSNRSEVEAAVAAEINSQAWEEGRFQSYTGDGELVTVETLEWTFMGCGVTAYDEDLIRPVIRELSEKIWGENAERPVLDGDEDGDEDALTVEECANNLLDLGEKIYSPECIACAANISYEEARYFYSQHSDYEFIEEVKNALCPPDDHPAIVAAASELLDMAFEENTAEDVLDELGIEYDDEEEEQTMRLSEQEILELSGNHSWADVFGDYAPTQDDIDTYCHEFVSRLPADFASLDYDEQRAAASDAAEEAWRVVCEFEDDDEDNDNGEEEAE